MSSSCSLAVILLACLTPLAAKPAIQASGGVRTLATVADSSVLARGSVFEVIGTALGPAEPATAEVPYPQDLAGVAVTLTATSDGSLTSAFLLSAAAGRIVAILPSSTPSGPHTVTVTYAGESSNTFKATVAESNFGLITNTGASGGMAQARVITPDAGPTPVTYVNSVLPGATLEFAATGLGPTGEPDNEFPVEANRLDGALLLIGGLEVAITYIGRDPFRPGYDLVRVTLPAEGIPPACAVMFQPSLAGANTSMFSIPLLAEPGPRPGPEQEDLVRG